MPCHASLSSGPGPTSASTKRSSSCAAKSGRSMYDVGVMATSPLPISPATRVRISPRVYARAFGEELVLLDFAAGEYFGLDAVGADVWRGLEAGQAIAEVARAIAARYDVASDQAERDIVQ